VLHRDGQGALIMVVAQTTGDDLLSVARLRQRFGMVTIVSVERAGASRGSAPPNASILRVTKEAPFATVWNRAMAKPDRARSIAWTGR
jgi:hypothetical protein